MISDIDNYSRTVPPLPLDTDNISTYILTEWLANCIGAFYTWSESNRIVSQSIYLQ